AGCFLLLALGACRREPVDPLPGPGVPSTLAERRARTISGLQYQLEFTIPDSLDRPITGRAAIQLVLTGAWGPLVLDWKGKPEDVRAVQVDGAPVTPTVRDEHVVVPPDRLPSGHHTVSFEFTATDLALNRRPDFMYALFVPDRARTAFPVFDQPDLKGR